MRALVVEDEAALRNALVRSLRASGWETVQAASGRDALALWAAGQPPDVVLLDLGLPDIDGLDVLQSARRAGHETPVLLLTARGTIGDRVLGLNFGADDYLLKPFDLGELHARLRALLRRAHRPAHAAAAAPHRIGALVRDAAGRFRCEARELDLTPREAALLGALVQRPHRAVAKQALLDAVFPGGGVQDEALEVVAHRLRRKLGGCGVAVVSLRGLGYLLKDQGG